MSKLPKIKINIDVDPMHLFWPILIFLTIVNFLILNNYTISLIGYTVTHLKILSSAGFIVAIMISLISFLYDFHDEGDKAFFENLKKIITSYILYMAIGTFILGCIFLINTIFKIDNEVNHVRTFLMIFISLGAGFLWIDALITLFIIIFLYDHFSK